ncbi:MAG: protein DpdH [Planctomycetaceae bacterium]|jgi:hypothetical protein
MTLADFWPTEQNILHCIKPEAESDWDEVFLAVHQPMRLMKKSFDQSGRSEGLAVTEATFLREFLSRDLPTGTLLMLILGDSGIGKSHLVRWLDVQLKRQPGAEQRHVIRIPKSSSLKTVLFEILKDLRGSQYDEIRRKLQAAREQLDVIGAEERIRAELLAAIRRKNADAKQNKETALTRGLKVETTDDEWVTHGDQQRGLPVLLSDAVTSQLFMQGAGNRPGIISQLALHLTTDSTDDRPPRRNFEDADFLRPESFDDSEAGSPARRYLQQLDRQAGRERKTAIRLLNGILDNALNPLASPTDTSLSEIFLEIRRQLLTEGRELVLLVEDFAVLSGIQGALLTAITREGVRDGTNELCPMRTALAVTSGYDFGRYDTVKTRAKFGWYVEESGAEEDERMLDRICDYVGAYLNASRFGAESLKQRHVQHDDKDWPPNFASESNLSDIEQNQLEVFGRSDRGWHLFPFNKASIRQLAEQHLRDAHDILRPNPRTIINHMLIAVLRDNRAAYLSNEFPAEGFLSFDTNQLNARLLRDVSDAESNRTVQKRYLGLLRYWGNNPRSLTELDLPEAVFDAFGIKPLRIPKRSTTSHVTYSTTGQDRPTSTNTPNSSPGTVSNDATTSLVIADDRRVLAETLSEAAPVEIEARTLPEEVRRWERTLNSWSPTAQMGQNDANTIRDMIWGQIMSAIDWDSLLLKSLTAVDMKGWKAFVYLPSSKGSGNTSPENALCVVCSPDDFAGGEKRAKVILALIALAKHEHYQSWDYEDSERDYACWQNLLEQLVPQATKWLIEKKYHSVNGDPVPALVESLLTGARVLNVKSAHATDYASLLSALFEPVPELPAEMVGEEWRTLLTETIPYRKAMQDELLARVAVRQGGSPTTYGIDAMRLVAIVRSLTKAGWKSSVQMPDSTGNPSLAEVAAFTRSLSRRLASAAKKRQDALAGIRTKYETQLGTEFDKAAVLKTLGDIVDEASQFGLLEGSELPKAAELRKLNEDFRAAPVKECLEKLVGSASDDFGTQLSSLAQVDDGTLKLIEHFIDEMSRCLKSLEGRLQADLSAGEGCVDHTTQSIENMLVDLTEQLNRLGGQAS